MEVGRRWRTWWRAAAVLGAVLGIVAWPTPEASSAPAGAHAGATSVLAGDFDGDGWGDLLTYRAGPAPDTIAWGPDHVPVGIAVHGTYRPVVGDFTGDEADDVFWYAPGPGVDTLWRWRGRSPSAVGFRVDGRYVPVVGDFDGNRHDDILWYSPGPGGDPLWLSVSDRPTFASARTTIHGTYRVAAGDFDGDGRDDLALHGPGAAPDHLSRFSDGWRLEHRPVAMPGNARLTAGEFGAGPADDLLLVALDGSTSHLWSDPATPGQRLRSVSVPPHAGAARTSFGRDDRDDLLFVDGAGVGVVRYGDDHGFAAVEDDTVALLGDSLALEADGHFRTHVRAVRGDGTRPTVAAWGGLAPCDFLDLARRTHARSVVLSYVGNAFTPCMADVGSKGRAAILARYSRDVRVLIDRLLASQVETIVIAGPPDFRNQDLSDIRSLYQSIAAERSEVHYRPAGAVLHGAGGYAETLPCRRFEGASHGCRGGQIQVRAADGVHLCPGWSCPPVWSSGANRYGMALADAALSVSPPRIVP